VRNQLLSSLLLAALVSCGGSSPATTTPVAPTPTSRSALTEGAATTVPVEGEEGPTAEEALAWVLSTIEQGAAATAQGAAPTTAAPTTAEIEEHFAPSFLKEVPPAKVVEIFAMLAQQLPPMKQLKADSKPPLSLTVVLDTAAGGVRVAVQMTSTTPRKIAGLIFQPATAEAPPRSYGDAVAQLEKAGAKTQLFVAEIVKGACKPYQNHQSLDRLAIGSSMKLWVLLALDEKLRTDKKLTWDSKLAVRDEARSLPSGEMQDLPAGTEWPLRDVAGKMISISDNTATDHLIDLVGREQVEKALALAKHGAPAVDTPFLRTRELFALKLTTTAAELEAYRKAPVAAKKKLLDGYRPRPIDLAQVVKDWQAPRALDLEWFANGPDLCNVMATLGTRAGWKPESELLTILGRNAGVPFDHDRWTYLGFKGGSEPGVINLTWLGRRSDDRWFVVVVTVNDDQHALDDALVANAAAGALAILGNEAAGAPPATPPAAK
jgi:beta-lactamase class A